MTAIELDHPTGALLSAYGLGQLNEEELAGIDRHLAECDACRQVVEGVSPDTLLTLLRSAATEPDSSAGNNPSQPSTPAAGPGTAPPAALMDHPRYRVGELLGVGGMGAVFKAEHLLMERPVALKVLNRELIDKPATIERFRREVRAAAKLTHPNIVAAFDAEQAGDVHFLAMEYVEGVSLARRSVDFGPMAVAEACDYARQAALGLQHAHECGMVHRDIKPQNLMLTPAGQVKILDFGLARFVMESVPAGALLAPGGLANSQATENWEKPLTQIGIVMGTPDYIAPEQARDSHLADIRADIYSLGCTLYDLLAGHAPFPEGSAVQKVKAHLGRTPKPLRDLRRDVPIELVRVIERMMAKDPANRFQTPAEVARALTPFVDTKPPRGKKWLMAAALAFVTALVAGVIIYVQTEKGRIVIETNDEHIAVMIEKAGGVKIVDQANKREYLLKQGEQELPTGDYQVQVSEALAGLDFQVKKFELKRGKEVRLRATFEAKGDGKSPEKVLTASERERAVKRVEALKQIAKLKETMHQSGTVPFDQVLDARREVAKAELNLCESDQERVAIHEKIVADAKEFVKFREAQFQAGQTRNVDVLKAKVDLLDAEAGLDRAKAETRARNGDATHTLTDGPRFNGKPASFWLNQVADANPKFRAEALVALGMIAHQRKELIPVLAASLQDKDRTVGDVAAQTLANVGPDAVPALLEVLKNKTSPIAVRNAAHAVAILGPEAKAAVPLLTKALNKDIWTAKCAAIALGRIGTDAKPAIPEIIETLGRFLRSKDSLNSLEYIYLPPAGIVDFGENSFPESLARALKQIDSEIQDFPPREKIRGKTTNEELKQALVLQWQQALDELKKKYAARTQTSPLEGQPDGGTLAGDDAAKNEHEKKNQGPLYRGKPASYWMAQFNDADPKLRAQGVEALGKLAWKNKALIPTLVPALQDNDVTVVRAASVALADLGPETVPLLLEVLTNHLEDTTSTKALIGAIEALTMMGPKAKAAVPLLTQVLKKQEGAARDSALFALGLIGPEAKPAIPVMLELLSGVIKSKGSFEAMITMTSQTGDNTYVFGFGGNTLISILAQSLKQIDPEIQNVLPTEPVTGKTLAEAKQAALLHIEVNVGFLQKKYPMQSATPATPSPRGPLKEGTCALQARYQLALGEIGKKHYDHARELLEQNLGPSGPIQDNDIREKSIFKYAELLFLTKDYDKAAQYFKEACQLYRLNPGILAARSQLADCYKKLADQADGKIKTAKDEITRAHFQAEHQRWLTQGALTYATLSDELNHRA